MQFALRRGCLTCLWGATYIAEVSRRRQTDTVLQHRKKNIQHETLTCLCDLLYNSTIHFKKCIVVRLLMLLFKAFSFSLLDRFVVQTAVDSWLNSLVVKYFIFEFYWLILLDLKSSPI